MRRKGERWRMRQDRLKTEITSYVGKNPGATANEIATHLAVNLKMKNHGVTPRKIGTYIRNNLGDKIIGLIDRYSRSTKIYFLHTEKKRPLTVEQSEEYMLEYLAMQDKPCTSSDVASYLTEKANGYPYNGKKIQRKLSSFEGVEITKRGPHSFYSLNNLEEIIKNKKS